MREIIIPYMKNQLFQKKLIEDQKPLIVMDVCTGQMTTAVLESYKENYILIVNVSANMSKYYQPLDLTVNGYTKWYMKNKFNSWYSEQVRQ